MGSGWAIQLASGGRHGDCRQDGRQRGGYLVSKKPYKDFVLRVEFWPSDDANSGIYFRCLDAKKITDRTCYEANIFDQRPDPSYGTGAITRYVEINPMPKETAELRNEMFDEGSIALQHGARTIKFRKVQIKPL
jgi:hypothetical protein